MSLRRYTLDVWTTREDIERVFRCDHSKLPLGRLAALAYLIPKVATSEPCALRVPAGRLNMLATWALKINEN